MALDTVKHAQENPDTPQPYKELGLKDDEYQRIKDILGLSLYLTIILFDNISFITN